MIFLYIKLYRNINFHATSSIPNEDLKSDKLFVLMSVNYSGIFYKYISKELQQDKQIIINAALSEKSRYQCLNYIPLKYKENKDFIKYFINYNSANIRFASDDLKNDIELVNFAINQSGFALQYLNEIYRDNEDIVRIAINNYPRCFQYISERFRDNEDIVRIAIKDDPKCFEYISERLRNNKEIIMECIKILQLSKEKYNNILRFVSEIHRNDKEIVLPLVGMNGSDLQYVSEDLITDKDVVYAAINNDSTVFMDADELFFEDREFILLCLNTNGYDEENYEKFLEDLIDNFKDDKDIVLAAVKKCGNNIKYASNRLKNDKDVVLAAIDNCYYDFYEYEKMSNDDICKDIKKRNINIDNILNETNLKDDLDILKQIIKKIKIN